MRGIGRICIFMYKAKNKKIYKEYIFIMFFVLLFTSCSSKDTKDTIANYYYKGNKWGTNQESIIKNEKKDPDEIIEGQNVLLRYKDVDYLNAGYKGTVEYILENDKLQEVYFDYGFLENADISDESIKNLKSTFKDMLDVMKNEFGEPSLLTTTTRKDDGLETIEELNYDINRPYGYTVQWFDENEEERERIISLVLYGEIEGITVSYMRIPK